MMDNTATYSIFIKSKIIINIIFNTLKYNLEKDLINIMFLRSYKIINFNSFTEMFKKRLIILNYYLKLFNHLT